MKSALYTRRGDDGTSLLYGTTVRIPKDDAVIEALGAVDELNSLLGVCRTVLPADARALIAHVQNRLFTLQAEIAGAHPTITSSHVSEIETDIADIEAVITVPHSFVIPGAMFESAMLDYARTVARRAERSLVRSKVGKAQGIAYLNRLSSLLYVLARHAAENSHAPEARPSY